MSTNVPPTGDPNPTEAPPVASSSGTRPKSTASAATDRRRIQTACSLCRRHKIRCYGGTPCDHCRLRNVVCEYSTPAKNTPAQKEGNHATSYTNPDLPRYDVPEDPPSNNMQPDQIYQAPAQMYANQGVIPKPDDEYCLGLNKQIIGQYITAFFKFVYPVSCMSFLHQATVLRQFHTRTMHLPLLKAISACALRIFSISDEDNERADKWMREVELDALQNLDDITIPRLQSLTLLTFFEFTYRVHSTKALMFIGIAARIGFAKRLHYEESSLSVVQQECRRRLMWSIFVLDKFCSGGIAELTVCPPEHMQNLKLPGVEQSFGFGTRIETQFLHERPTVDTQPITSKTVDTSKGMDEFGYTVRLLDLLRKIHKFNKRTASTDPDLYSIHDLEALEADISSIESSFPAVLKWTKPNILQRVHSSSLSSFVMLHTWLHQCRCDLYRMFVQGAKDPLPVQNFTYEYLINMRMKCLGSVIGLTDTWAEVLHVGLAKPVHDPAIAGCALQCAKLMILINGDPTIPAADKDRLQVCQMILEPLKDIYPKAKIHYDSICELRAEVNSNSVQPTTERVAHENGQDMMMGVQSNNDEQVRGLLGQF